MIRYDLHFRTLPPVLQASGIQRSHYAGGGIFNHRAAGFGPEDDEAIVQQFDLTGLSEFWDMELSEPLTCKEFARSLAVHFMVIRTKPGMSAEQLKLCGPAASAFVDGVDVGIRQALRAARAAGEPWFLDIPDPPPNRKLDPNRWMHFMPGAVVVPAEPPKDGIDLTKLRVRPRAAAEWLLSMPTRRHLVPPSLARVLTGKPKEILQSERHGRPKGTGYAAADRDIARGMLRIVERQEQPSLTKAAEQLIGRDGKGAPGNGQPASKFRRLVALARRLAKNGE